MPELQESPDKQLHRVVSPYKKSLEIIGLKHLNYKLTPVHGSKKLLKQPLAKISEFNQNQTNDLTV